jgi:tRNA pseudouridine38-40 synthase
MNEPALKTRNILLSLRFDGTAYHGWQVQKNAVTIQQTLQDALEKVLKVRPPVTGCSRTDAGVHANEYICNFHTFIQIPCESLRKALNVNLPKDIAVNACREVQEPFHARYAACAKEYHYKVWNGATRDPFLNRYTLFYPYRLDIPAMQRAAAGLLGSHDFSAFRASGSKVEDTVRNILLFDIEREGSLVTFRVRADGFLYNMVRIMTGTLLNISQGLISEGDIPEIIASRSRVSAGKTLPPHGLYLNKVFYEAERIQPSVEHP